MDPERPELSVDPAAAADAAPTGTAPPATEPAPSLEELVRAAELKAAEHHDAWLRARAEADNIRKRAQEDVAKAHRYGIEKFAADLLAVKDSLEATLASENAA